jgi:hypothetical protein
MGGKGPYDTDDCPSTQTDSGGVQKPIDFGTRFNPETCPQCGLQPFVGFRNEVIYEITNPEVIVTTVDDSPLFQVNTAVVPPSVSLQSTVGTGVVQTSPVRNPVQVQPP